MRHLAIGSARPLIRCLLAFGLGLGFLAPPLAAFGADQATIDAAIEEGRLVYATNAFAPTTQEELHAEFRKFYDLPESFAIEGNIGNSSATVSRISQEVDANAVTVDWVSVNVATFWTGMREQGHILEYCSEEYEALEYIEEAAVIDGGCQFQTLTAIAFGVIWHPQYVEEDLTTWAQLADPKYKDMIIFGDVRKSAAYLDAYVGLRENDVWTIEWLEKMKAQNPFFLLRSTDIRDRVMSGEFPIAVLGYPPRAYQVRDQIDMKASFPSEGVVVAGNYGGILADAPHPNAAKIWTDFLFSQKGQEILVRLEAIGSLRADVEVPPDVQPFVPDPRKVKAVPVDWAGLTEEKLGKYREEFRSIFGQ